MRMKKILLSAMITVATVIIPSLAYGQAYGTVATETLNARAGAKTTAKILEQLSLGQAIEVVAEQDGWLKIALADETRAYVKSDYLAIHRVVATVEVNGGLNVRDYPSTTKGKITGKFYQGDEISVHFKVGDWYKVSQEGFEGYVHKDYIKADFLKHLPIKELKDVKRIAMTQKEVQSLNTVVVPATSNKTSNSQNTGTSSVVSSEVTASQGKTTGDVIVTYAKQFLGNPYVYGGNSLTSGVDCSGFTQQIMKHFGISISRSSSAQYANSGYSVSSSNLQKGDLLFYGYNGHVSHVAIYIGGGQVIHANDERTGICIGKAFPSNGKPFIGAKRVI